MPTGTKIVALGDSITYGFPYTPASSWVDLAARELDVVFINSGINGDTTNGMLARFQRDVLRHDPSHVVVMGGTNDAFAGGTAKEVKLNLQAMLKLAVCNAVIPILGLPIPCNFRVEESLLSLYRQEMRQHALQAGIAVLDFCVAMAGKNGDGIKSGLHVDGVHPNEAGYRLMAAAAVKKLQPLIHYFA